MSFPAVTRSRVARDHPGDGRASRDNGDAHESCYRDPVAIIFDDGSTTSHGGVAAITSCTNTSKPSVMVHGRPAKAVERGLVSEP